MRRHQDRGGWSTRGFIQLSRSAHSTKSLAIRQSWRAGRAQVTMGHTSMKPTTRPAADPDLTFPDLALEVVEDLSPKGTDGFLRLVRRRLEVRYPDGTRSAP